MQGDKYIKPELQHPEWFGIFFLLILFISGCSITGNRVGPLATPNPNALPTPTPFGPFGDGDFPEPFAPVPLYDTSGDWGGFAGPTVASAIEIPEPMPLIPGSPRAINFVLLGSDTRPGFAGNRTDTIMIISMDPSDNTVTMISIPRDLYVYIPGWKVNRINTADQHGGPELVAETILYNLGVEIHHFVRVSFDGFVTAVDMLGGIDVVVEKTIHDECDEQPVSYAEGPLHLDGYSALCYARVRKTSSDFARSKRQQQVIEAIFSRILSIDGLSKVPQLYSQFGELAVTDVDFGEILSLVPLAASVAGDSSRIQGYAIDQSLVTNYRVPGSGAAVLLPKREAIIEMLTGALAP
jgi:polyisoprenyl-teichoic acid--peptidoglycan teichoic acid transferase